MTNKDLIDKLCKYFKEDCDHDIVCRLLANMMIDMHRIRNFEHIAHEERESLNLRMIHNEFQLEKFIKKDGKLPGIRLSELNH